MAGAKLIIVFIIFINLFSVLASQDCADAGFTFTDEQRDSSIASRFYDFSAFACGSYGSQADATTDFTGTIGGLGEAQGGTESSSESTSFLDLARMVLALFTFLTPLPLLSVLPALGLPGFINLLLGVPLFLLWGLSLAEFWKGSAL